MIIARGQSGEKELLVFGLSAENVARLVAGQPIWIKPETHPGIPPGWEIMILYGATEAVLAKALEEAGAIGPETKINRDPRL